MTSKQLFASFAELGQNLGESELSFESARWQVGLIVELACVGNPLVNQNQAWPIFDEQLAQDIARARRLLIVGLDPRKRLLASKLPGQFAPERAYDRAIRLRSKDCR